MDDAADELADAVGAYFAALDDRDERRVMDLLEEMRKKHAAYESLRWG